MKLNIRTEQMEALAAPHLSDFVGRLVAHLRESFPEANEEPDEELTAAVEELVEKADSYGLTTGAQAAAYVTCAWLLGADFDSEFPAAGEMLESPDYSPDEKAEWLAEWSVAMLAALEQD